MFPFENWVGDIDWLELHNKLINTTRNCSCNWNTLFEVQRLVDLYESRSASHS